MSILWSIRSLLRFTTLLVSVAVLAACNEPTEEKMSRAEPPRMRGECVLPSERELQILQTAANAIALDDSSISNFMTIGAKKLLGNGLNSQVPKHGQRVCTPETILSQVGSALAAKGLGAGQLVEYQLELAVQLPNPSDFVIQQVGKAAFNSSKQHSEIFPRQDIRPLARSALARFGRRASAFSETAVREMNGRSPLGTGAAQVAAATGHPAALPWISQEFDSLLASVSNKVAIPLDKRDRLLELAWAVYFAGDAGRSAAAPIHRIMARKVESRAPPFGIVELWPKRFCRVLELVEGAPALDAYAYCLDSTVPFEQ